MALTPLNLNVTRQFPDTRTDQVPFLLPFSSWSTSPGKFISWGFSDACNLPRTKRIRDVSSVGTPDLVPRTKYRSRPRCLKLSITDQTVTHGVTGYNVFRQPNARVEPHLTATDRSDSEGRKRSSVGSNALLGGGSVHGTDTSEGRSLVFILTATLNRGKAYETHRRGAAE